MKGIIKNDDGLVMTNYQRRMELMYLDECVHDVYCETDGEDFYD